MSSDHVGDHAEFVEGVRVGVANLAAPPEIQSDWAQWVMESAFEGVWARSGLGLRERSVATIATLTALHRPPELRAHIRIGLRNGLTRSEIAEAIMHVAVYAGVPAAVEGMRAASEVFAALDA